APAAAQFTDQRTWGGTAAGSANAIVITIPNYFAHTLGVPIRFKALTGNTGATTIAISGLSPVSVVRKTPSGTVGLTGGEIIGGWNYAVMWDGAAYQLQFAPDVTGQRTLSAAGSLVTGDCGNTVILGATSTFFALTVGAATGFPVGC